MSSDLSAAPVHNSQPDTVIHMSGQGHDAADDATRFDRVRSSATAGQAYSYNSNDAARNNTAFSHDPNSGYGAAAPANTGYGAPAPAYADASAAPTYVAPAPAPVVLQQQQPAAEVHNNSNLGSSHNAATHHGVESQHIIGTAVPLEGHRYLVTDAPKPLPAVLGDTPDIWFRDYQSKMKAEAVSKEEERLRGLKQKKEETKGGVGYKIGKFFSNTGASVSKTVDGAKESHETNVRDSNIKQAKARLLKYWPHHSADGFIVEFDCDGIHNNRPVRGHVLLTRSSLLFVGKGSHNLLVVDEIPLSDIVSYSKGVSVPCNEKEMRWVLDIPNAHIKADSVQIFTKKAMHYNLINISHSIKDFADGHPEESAYDRFLNYFDHAWRAAI